jgi:hypothetical protein
MIGPGGAAMNPRLRLALLITAATIVSAGLGWWGWRTLSPAEPPAATPPGVSVIPPAPSPALPAATASEPVVAGSPAPEPHPSPPAPTGEPPLAAADIAAAVAALAGSPAGAALLQTADFPRRFVATVDNLGRSHAPPLLWPVAPAAGRFTTEPHDGTEVIAVVNGQRYAPLVALAEALDPQAAARLYRRLHPQLQQAYEDLGFPGRPFHARLLQVIDLLLATPVPAEPPGVMLTEVKGTIPSTRPWVRYEFTDPALQSLSAGQKIRVRGGAIQLRRLRAKLAQLRRALVAPAGTR